MMIGIAKETVIVLAQKEPSNHVHFCFLLLIKCFSQLKTLKGILQNL